MSEIMGDVNHCLAPLIDSNIVDLLRIDMEWQCNSARAYYVWRIMQILPEAQVTESLTFLFWFATVEMATVYVLEEDKAIRQGDSWEK